MGIGKSLILAWQGEVAPQCRAGRRARRRRLRSATRRYHLKYRNQKTLERTQDWIKLGGKVRPDEERALILEQIL
ncbi:hypothetical protein ELG62_03925 [Rhizobium leguminosarum]|nr:hypothetical protein ELG62_03925 [Rhizobium leguminosarum]